MSRSGPLPPQAALYRAVWRWHFVAGLFALPFLLNLAITGGLYLFAPEINHILYRSLEDVPARADARLPASVLIQKGAEATQGDVLRLTLRSEPDKSIELLIRTDAGESRTAYLDPYDGCLLGTIPVGGVMEIVRKIHSLQYFGFWASCLVEIAAGLGHRSRAFGNFSVVAARPEGRCRDHSRDAKIPDVLARSSRRDRALREQHYRVFGGNRNALVEGLGKLCPGVDHGCGTRPAKTSRRSRAKLEAREGQVRA